MNLYGGKQTVDDNQKEIEQFWVTHFSKAYPYKLEPKGMSFMKLEIIKCIETDTTVNFKSKLVKMIASLNRNSGDGEDKCRVDITRQKSSVH